LKYDLQTLHWALVDETLRSACSLWNGEVLRVENQRKNGMRFFGRSIANAAEREKQDWF